MTRHAADAPGDAIEDYLDRLLVTLSGRHVMPAAGVPSTRATDPLNSRHCSACSARAAAPAGVSR